MANNTKETVVSVCSKALEEHFKQHPFEAPFELEEFVPGEHALLANFFKNNVSIPKDPTLEESFPCLLLHDLENPSHKQKAIYKFIDQNAKDHANGLYGTSGAGKTRSLWEYLSHNYGLYFVANTQNDAGSRDMQTIINWFGANEKRASGSNKIEVSHANYGSMKEYVSILIHVRNAVFREINKQLQQKGLDKLTPYQWLLIQLYPHQALQVDLFDVVFRKCFRFAYEGDWEDNSVTKDHMKAIEKWSVIAVDETQVLLEQLRGYFLSLDGNTYRSAFSALLYSFELLAAHEIGYPLFSGTGMAIDDFEEQAKSIMAKRLNHPEREFVFKDFKVLDAQDVKSYMGSFLYLQGSGVEDSVIQHVSKWLRGRPRWTASFLEVYLVREKVDGYQGTRGQFSSSSALLMEALDRYLAVMTTDPKSPNRRQSFSPGSYSAYAAIMRAVTKHPNYKVHFALQRAIFRFVVGGRPTPISEQPRMLIEVGVAAVAGGPDEAVIDEPIIVQAGINFFTLEDATTENLVAQEQGGLGEAFEKIMLPAIQKKLRALLQTQHKGDNAFPEYNVSCRSAYGVLAMDCKESIESTLNWIEAATNATFEGQVPPFCYPDDHFGPDLMFLMWNNSYSGFISAIAQAKYRRNFTQESALRTITPSLLYHQNRDSEPSVSEKLTEGLKDRWERLKEKVIGDDRGCLRLMVQYPSKKKRAAAPGRTEDDSPKAVTNPPPDNPPPDNPPPKPARSLRARRKRKLGWLSTVSQENADTFFDGDALAKLKALKSPKPPKSPVGEPDGSDSD